MIGSEKQIKWAENIIARIVAAAEKTKAEINAKSSASAEKAVSRGNQERAEKHIETARRRIEEIDEVFDYIPKIELASKVIAYEIVADRAEQGIAASWPHIAADVALMAGIRI